MSTNHHTAIAAGADVNVASVNVPLGQLDSAISGLQSGATSFNQLNLGTDTTVNISGGIIAITKSRHLVETEASAASDDVDTITGGVEGDVLMLQCVSASRVVTLKHNTGNIWFRDGADRSLYDVYQTIVLIFDGFKWTDWNGQRIGVGLDSSLTISAGEIEITRPHHVIDTEGAAAADDLEFVTGGEEGQLLVLSIASAARLVTVVTTGNIRTFNNMPITLSSTTQKLMLAYDGASWCEVNAGIVMKAASYNSLTLFREAPVFHGYQARNHWTVKAAAATIAQNGIAAPTATGTPSASNDTDSTYINLATGGGAGNLAGYTTATFNLVRRQHNPVFHLVMRTGSDISSVRFWIGLFSAAPTNVDTLAASTSALCFRYSTNTTDAGWIPVTSDGSSQSTATAIGTVATSTRYLLSIEMDSANGVAKFRVNNDRTTERSISTTLPATTTELGASWYIIAITAAVRNWKFSRCICEYD